MDGFTSPSGYNILELGGNDHLCGALYHDVLRPAFNDDELEPFGQFRMALSHDDSDRAFGLCAVDPDERPIGGVVFYPYREEGVLLLGYIATRSIHRSAGVAAALYAESRRRWFSRGEFDLVLAEIEDPRFFSDVRGISPERRVHFYSKLGADLVVGPYFQPRVHPHTKRVHNMLLVLLQATSQAREVSDRALRTNQLVAFLKTYFMEEGAQSERERKESRWLIDWYEQSRSVPLVPIAQYRLCQLPAPPD